MRQRFEHLVRELSDAVGEPIPRYRLWLRLHEHGWDPERLSGGMALAFCEGPLLEFLVDEGLALHRRAYRSLQKAVSQFIPDDADPAESFAGFAD